ncbi:AAC(3) family N-acetyltransferase [Campylobacter pinnipediorum]|nr:AAC(3) family N-acetyltransferase [Campylobacter pinnipediorum]
MMPTFTYSFCDRDIYDKEKSKSKVGILGEFFRKLKGVYRTDDPIFSFAVSAISVVDARKNLNLFVDILKKDENYFNL